MIGSGALGGYYGGLLCRAGYDVHFLARSDAEHLSRSGLRVDSPRGDFRVSHLRVWADPAKMPQSGTVLACIKTPGNADLLRIVQQVLVPGGTLVLVQNGLGQEERFAQLPRIGRIIAGLGFICAARVAPGHIVHQDYGALRLSEYSPDQRPAGVTDALRRLAQQLAAASIDVELDEDCLAARWKKLVWNVPFNGLSVLLRADTRALVNDEASVALVRMLMGEVAGIAVAEGKRIDTSFIDQMIAATRRMQPYLPSMRLDFEAGRELEIDAMYWEPLRRAQRHGVAAPSVHALVLQLEILARARPGQR